MRKLIIVVASLLVVVLFILQGFQQTHPLPEPDNNRQSTATGEGIADALDAIYFDVSIMGVQDATAERLAQVLERQPNAEEIATALGQPLDRVERVLEA